VALRGRGENFMRPNAKGSKPMINRPITRFIMKDAMQGWIKKYRRASDIEDIMKKVVYGKVQFQWCSNHFTDDIPWMPGAGQTRGGNNAVRDAEDHPMEDTFYVRKYIEPQKFKKLEIANWEMPEAFTKSVTLQELVAAGMQYGHSAGVWNPKMLKYLYAEHDGTHIFDLVQTAACLNRACYYVMEAASKGAEFLFTGTKSQASPIIKAAAKRTGMHYCQNRYVGGIMTNWQQVQKGVVMMRKMQREYEQGAWKILGENAQKENKMKLARLNRLYLGVGNMHDLPDILICVDEIKERNAIMEADRIGIPVVALIDSNSNPDHVDLPIPGNASGSRAIDLVIGKLTEAIMRGRALRDTTDPGDREVIEKEWDPWVMSRDRLRGLRRRSKRQPWHKTLYGGYEQYKKAHPFGRIPGVAPFHKFSWKS